MAFFLQVPKLCTHLDLTLLYILIVRTHTNFVKKTMLSARRLLQAYDARALAAGLPQDHV